MGFRLALLTARAAVRFVRIFGLWRSIRAINEEGKAHTRGGHTDIEITKAREILGIPTDWNYSADGLRKFARNPEIDFQLAVDATMAVFTAYDDAPIRLRVLTGG